VDKVEHNHPDLILQVTEGPTAVTTCRDDSVVERAKFKKDKCRLGKAVQARPRRPSYRTRGVLPKQTVASLAKLKAFRLQKAAAIGSVNAIWKRLKSSGYDVCDWWQARNHKYSLPLKGIYSDTASLYNSQLCHLSGRPRKRYVQLQAFEAKKTKNP
jgi:hypothetical protein